MPWFWIGASTQLWAFAAFATRTPFQKYRILELKIVSGAKRQ
jgi:hypothetical protein